MQSEQLARETAERKKAEVWESLLPKWDSETATPEGKKLYRKLWWNGIPPKYRGVVWKKALGNELEITETTYNIALEKSQVVLRDHVKQAVPSSWDPAALARWTSHGTISNKEHKMLMCDPFMLLFATCLFYSSVYMW